MIRTWPYAIRHTPPHPGCVPLPMPERPGDAPEGTHSGGLWYDQEYKLVWKPLLGLFNQMPEPYYTETNELALLTVAAAYAVPCFPKNWEHVIAADRPWIVRPLAYPINDLGRERLLEIALQVEQGVRRLNQLGWEVGDHCLNVLLDKQSHDPFVVDCSCAANPGPNRCIPFTADDSERWLRWIKALDLHDLAALRAAGRRVVSRMDPTLIAEYHGALEHVYLSTYRPFSFVWANHDDEGTPIVAECFDRPVHDRGIYGWTWVVTTRPLSADYLRRYQLTYAWSPVPRLEEESSVTHP